MKKLICFCGVIGSGKDYQSNKLQKETGGLVFDFSDGVRELLFKFLGVDPPKDEREYNKFKETTHYSFLMNNTLYHAKGRDLLENVGATMREYNSEFWIDYCERRMELAIKNNLSDTFIVNSVRYINEAHRLFDLAKEFDMDIKFIFCNHKSDRYEIRNHESEKLAQKLLSYNLIDGQDITEILKTI